MAYSKSNNFKAGNSLPPNSTPTYSAATSEKWSPALASAALVLLLSAAFLSTDASLLYFGGALSAASLFRADAERNNVARGISFINLVIFAILVLVGIFSKVSQAA